MIADWRKATKERIKLDKSLLNERKLAIQREIQELKKSNEVLKSTFGFSDVGREK